MTNVKRPILLQVRSSHDSNRAHTNHRANNDIENGLVDRATFRQDNDDDSITPFGPGIIRRRPIKTQSLVLPSPSCDGPPPPLPGSITATRASVPTKFEDQLQFFSSNSSMQDEMMISSPAKSSPADRFSTCSSASSSSTSTSSSSSGSVESDSPSLILPYLYVGDQAQTQIDTISSLNISYILSLQSLPKFLSNSPQSTPTSSFDNTDMATEEVSPQIEGLTIMSECVTKTEKINHDMKLLSKVNTNNRETIKRKSSLTKSSNNSSYDIIDGGDGGLLPSVNSSKDYLVKIKPLDVKLEAHGKNEKIVRMQLGQESNNEDQQSSSDIDRDSVLDEDQTKCDTTIMDSTTTGQVRAQARMNISDDELNSDQSLAKKLSNLQESNRQSDEDEATSSSGALLGCSLKQRCNRLSSSVHRLIRGKCINISDTFEQLLDKFFDETHNFIEEARRNKCNVLVHCKAGISRSPTIAIAYLMKWKRLHLQDAYNFVKQCRPQISPNLNFMGQLVSYERQLQRDRSQLPSPTYCCLPSPIPTDNSSAIASSSEVTNSNEIVTDEHKTNRDGGDGGGASQKFSNQEDENDSKSHHHKRARVRNFFRCINQQKPNRILPHDAHSILH